MKNTLKEVGIVSDYVLEYDLVLVPLGGIVKGLCGIPKAVGAQGDKATALKWMVGNMFTRTFLELACRDDFGETVIVQRDKIIRIDAVNLYKNPEVDQSSKCPHGAAWDECPDCRH